MAVNLFGRSSSFEKSMAHIAQAFGEKTLWTFKPTKEGNTVVLALAQPQAVDTQLLSSRAEAIQARFGLPAPLWLKSLKPFSV
jgi:hypothetical protein